MIYMMMKRKTVLAVLVMTVSLIGSTACGTTGPEIDEDIVLVECANGDFRSPTYFMASWRSNSIFATSPIRKFSIRSNLEPDSTTEIYWDEIRDELTNAYGLGSYLTANQTGTGLLIVRSNYGDASDGALYAYDLEGHELTLLRDSTYHISSAVYWPDDDSKPVYYSYGRPIGEGAGYYLLFIERNRPRPPSPRTSLSARPRVDAPRLRSQP